MKSKLKNISACLLLASLSTTASAAGFAIKEQSITNLGRAFAGSAAAAEDASTIFFNPAGLTYLEQGEIDLGMNYIRPQTDFNDDGSSPMTGDDGGNAGKEAFVPNFYLSHPLNDTVTVGLGVSAPFGLVTEYGDNWIGRYLAVKSEMLTVNFNPSIAIKATEKLSVGLGISAQYIDVKLTKMVPIAGDSKVKLQGDDWGYGFNVGLMYQATEDTRLGLSYRSKISHTLEGDGKLAVLDVKEKISADLDLPETVSFALHHQLNEKWSLLADATLTRWSRFEELVIESDGMLNSEKPENWENSMRYGIGFNYQHSDKWLFRGGVAYDETPIPSSEYRTARIADADRTWVAVGASYQYSDSIIIDAAYTHIFMNDPKIDETEAPFNLKGRYDASVDIVGVQLRWLM